MRTLLLALALTLLVGIAAHAADTWQEYASYAKTLEPLPPTPMGDSHIGLVESGKTTQVRLPVPTPLPVAYRANLSNVVAFSGKGSSYQLVVHRDSAEGPVVYEGPVITSGDAWNQSNAEPIDLTAALKPEDAKTGYLDLFVTGIVKDDGWTMYRYGSGRAVAALAVTLTPEMQAQIEAGKRMQKLGLALLPLPKECVVAEGMVAVGLRFDAKGLKPVPAIGDSLRERCKQLGLSADPQGAAIRLSIAKPTGHVNGYTLTISKDGVKIVGDDEPGLFYGMQTLCQLLRKSPEGGAQAPALQIKDWPSFPLRGFQYDIARGQSVNLDYCKRMIRETARYKMNCIMYYMEDDYKFEKYPFTGRPGTFTKAKAQELSKYADQYHVMLIPQYESLGHAGAVLSHPEFADLREGNSSWVFCTNEPKVWQFLDDAYAELAEAFPNSKYIHVGGDEFEGPFGTCPRCRAIRDKDGLGALYVLHMNKLNELCKKYHRTMMFWPSHRGP
ncbi:MAG: family 20 glycosylhydrolase, partial [Armatimonadota bacterium]